MPFFPKIGFLRRMSNRDTELATLDKDIEGAAGIADPGERMLRYDELASQANTIAFSAESYKVMVAGGLTVLGGFAATIVGMASLNLPLLAGGIATLYGAMTFGRNYARDTEEAAGSRRDTCRKAIKEIEDSTDVSKFAPSPQFDKVMARFEGLREKFILAAAREKLMPAAALVVPQGKLNL